MKCNENDKHTQHCTCIWKPNEFISYQTIKREIKYKINQREIKIWNQYVLSRATKWANHYHLFSIKYHKTYSNELYPLTQSENIIRMMLYTNHLPLNAHEYYMMQHTNNSPYCDHPGCNHQHIEESLHHFLCECPRYESHDKFI